MVSDIVRVTRLFAAGLIATVGLCLLAPNANGGMSFSATSIAGNQAPPPYGLRLDGFFNGNTSQEVTFGFDSVLFDEFDDGTARLHGLISVVEVDGAAPTGSQISSWNMDVRFVGTTGSDPAFGYYNIDGSHGPEMVRVGDLSDTVELITYPTDGSKPFQVGDGANGKNSNFGAAGWVNFDHNGIPGLSTHNYASDFLMDLTFVSHSPVPIPEPSSFALLAMGGLTLCGYGWRRRRKTEQVA